MEVGSAFVSLLPSARGFGSRMDSEVGGQVDSAGKRMGASFGKIFGAVAALGIGAAVGSFLKDSIEEARDAQVVGARTESVIKSMGNASKITAEQVGDLAGALSNKTAVDDEAIQSGQNLLLTFGNVRNELGKGNDIFSQTSALMVDMSVAMGTDMKGSAIQLGKALNDPVKGVSALSRVGVSFTEQQKEQIKTLTESGDILGAQKVVLGELEKQFGGAAASMATPAQRASVAWGNFKEQIGTALLPTLDRLLTNLSDRVIPAISRFADVAGPVVTRAFEQTKVAVSGLLTSLAPTAQAFTANILPSLQRFGTYFQATLLPAFLSLARTITTSFLPAIQNAATNFTTLVLPALQRVGSYILTTFGPVFTQLVGIIQTRVIPILGAIATYITGTVQPALVAFGQKIATNVRPAFDQLAATFQAKILPALEKVLAKWQEWGPTITTVLKHVAKLVGGLLLFYTAIAGKVMPIIIRIIGFMAGAWVSAFIAAANHVQRVIGIMSAFGKGVQSAVSTAVAAVGRFLNAVQDKFGAAVTFVKGIPAKMKSAIGSLGSTLYSAGASLIQGLIDGVQSKISSLTSKLSSITKLIPDVKGPPKKDAVLLRPAGQLIMGGLIAGIGDGEAPLTQRLEGLTERLGKTIEAGVEKAGTRTKEAMTKLIDGLKSQVDNLKGLMSSLSDSVAQNFASDAFSQTTALGFSNAFTNSVYDLERIKAALAKLKKAGASSGFLSQLYSKGNAELILDLAGSGSSFLATAQSAYMQEKSLTASLGTQVARNEYGPKFDRLSNQLERLEKAVDRIGPKVGKEINKASAGAKRSAA